MTLYDPCAAGQCVDYRCAMYGCMRRNTHMAIIQPVTQGCICPPTSEQTCQNDRCPRKPWKPHTMIPTPTEPSDCLRPDRRTNVAERLFGDD